MYKICTKKRKKKATMRVQEEQEPSSGKDIDLGGEEEEVKRISKEPAAR